MAYTPERGDAIWLDFDPQIGHEQAGRRPALVLAFRLQSTGRPRDRLPDHDASEGLPFRGTHS